MRSSQLSPGLEKQSVAPWDPHLHLRQSLRTMALRAYLFPMVSTPCHHHSISLFPPSNKALLFYRPVSVPVLSPYEGPHRVSTVLRDLLGQVVVGWKIEAKETLAMGWYVLGLILMCNAFWLVHNQDDTKDVLSKFLIANVLLSWERFNYHQMMSHRCH
jgi:hypothetical protein